MEPPPLETVYKAIVTLYDNPNPAEKEKASLWLAEVQKSIHAWKICDNILLENRNVQSSYFAAQTMRSKIYHSFKELPADSYDSLLNSLTSHIQNISPESSTAIITQLAIALSDLVLQLPTWRQNINDLIQKLSTNHAWALLEFLTVLPQEIDAPGLRLGENRRHEIRVELRSNPLSVEHFLKQCLLNSGQNPNIAMNVFKCFNSWIQIKAINFRDLQNNTVLAHCFQVLNEHTVNNILHETACDCVCSLLQSLYGYETIEEIGKLVYNSIVRLEESYHMAVAHEDQEKASNYCRLFTELAETFLSNIIMAAEYSGCANSHYASGALDLVLLCVGHHDYEIAEITFNLWYRISEEFFEKDNPQLADRFAPYIERLITALYRHCQMEPDCPGILEEGDDFYDFRLKVFEVVIDVAFIMGSSNVFKQMFMKLQQPDLSWEQTEAALYIMQAIAKNIIPEEEEVVPKVVEAILGVPENAHVAVRRTCVFLLGELSDWIAEHTACLPTVFEYLLNALNHASVSSASAISIQNICKSSRGSLAPQLPCLLQLCAHLDSFNLNADASVALLRGTAAVISMLPHHEIKVQMCAACKPLADSLSQSVDPIVWLDRIAALFKDTEIKMTSDCTEHPCLPALTDIWPVISNTMDKFCSDSRIIERLCRTLRFCVRCIGSYAHPLLQTLVEKIVQLYTAQGHSCFLYLSSILVDEFSLIPPCVPGLIILLQALMPKAFDILAQEHGLINNPDTVDDLFRLANRFVQRIPQSFLECPVVASVVECAIMSCQLDHKDANSSVMKFLNEFVHLGQSRRWGVDVKNAVERILDRYGQHLMNTLIHSMIYCLHPQMLGEVASVIMELMIWNKTKTGCWLEETLRHLQRSATPPRATDQQISQFHECLTISASQKEMNYVIHEFTRLFR